MDGDVSIRGQLYMCAMIMRMSVSGSRESCDITVGRYSIIVSESLLRTAVVECAQRPVQLKSSTLCYYLRFRKVSASAAEIVWKYMMLYRTFEY